MSPSISTPFRAATSISTPRAKIIPTFSTPSLVNPERVPTSLTLKQLYSESPIVWWAKPSNCVPTWPISLVTNSSLLPRVFLPVFMKVRLVCRLKMRVPKNGMPGPSTYAISITSPVLISRTARNTVSGFFMWLPEPRASPAPHFDGHRWLSEGRFQTWAAAKIGTASKAAAGANAMDFMFSSLSVVVDSRLVHFVHCHDRKRSRAAGVVDPGNGEDPAPDLRGGEAVARREHARQLCPAVGFRVVHLVRAEHPAEFLDPAFAAEHVHFAVHRLRARAAPRGGHRQARGPGVGRDVVSLVHRYIRRPPVRDSRSYASAHRIDFAVGVGNAVVVARQRHGFERSPAIGLGVEHLERREQLDRPAAGEPVGQIHARRDFRASGDVDLGAYGDCGERAAWLRHRRKRAPGSLYRVVHPCLVLRPPGVLAALGQAEPAEDVELVSDRGRGAVMHRNRIGRQLRPLVRGGIELPEDAHGFARGILAAVDEHAAADVRADDFVGALRDRRALFPRALREYALAGRAERN